MGNSVVAVPSPPSNVVLDIDGCLTLGERAVPGAAEAILALTRRGINCIIATNNSTRSRQAVAAMLTDLLGIAIAPASVVTSALAAAALLEPAHSPALVVGEEGVRSALAEAGIVVTDEPEEARSVVVGLDRSFDYAAMGRASRAVIAGAFLVATNDDATFPTPGRDLPGAGALVAAIERASGGVAVVAGKPHLPMLRAVAKLLAPGTTWMVGDRPETDIAFARAAGWEAVLVLSGITRDASGVPAHLAPDAVIPSVADLPRLLA